MKVFNLTYNELVKQFKKPSVKIIFAIILISAMVLPFVVSKLPTQMYSQYNEEADKYLLQDSQNYADTLKDGKTQKEKMKYGYALIDVEFNQLSVDNKIGYGDWREKELQEYRSVSYQLANRQFILDGFTQENVLEVFQSDDPKELSEYYKLSLDKKKEIEAELIAKKERIKNIIINSDYTGHTEEEINRNNDFIAYFEKDIAEYEKLKAKSKLTEEEKARFAELEKEQDSLRERINNFKQDNKILEFRLANKIDYSKDNWKNNSINTIEKELDELRKTMLSEKDYSSQAAMQGLQMTYDEYVKDYNKKNEERVNKIREVWYGLENNIPDLNDITDARSVLDGTYEIYIILAVIMVIIIGAGIVATEFSKGTIRLLLIRPVSRWKVLLSKLLAVLVIGFSVVVLGIGILYVSTGATFGFETYNTPLLSTVDGAIVQSSYISFLMPKIVLSCASLVFITSVVFAISTLAKNTALAVAVSMILYLGVTFATDMLVSWGKAGIVSTFVPYINASYFRLVPMTSEALSTNFGIQMQYQSGAIQLLIVSIVLLVATFAIFMKKDIKN